MAQEKSFLCNIDFKYEDKFEIDMDRKRKIVNIGICSSGVVCSGGEKCFVELVKQFYLLGYDQEIFLGLDVGKSDIVRDDRVKIIFVKKNHKEKANKSKGSVLLLYGNLFFRSIFSLRKYKEKIIVISHSDAWPDVVFAYLLKWLNPDAYWIAINHMLLPEKKYDTNVPIIRFYNYLNQCIFFLLQRKSNLLVSVNEMYRKQLERRNKNVLIIQYGKEREFERVRSFGERNTDICFIGRFFHQKGVYQILEICREIDRLLPKEQPKLSFQLIGEINPVAIEIRDGLKELDNRFVFDFTGFISGDAKYELLGKSKVFMFPSLFESFGIVYLDAISVGTPVVEYDLECFGDHKEGVLKAPFKNNKIFAQKIVEILKNRKYFEELSGKGYAYSSNFSWKNTADRILNEANKAYEDKI